MRIVPLAAQLLLGVVLLVRSHCIPSATLDAPPPTSCVGRVAAPERLRVATYNIHGGVASSLDRIAEVLDELDADVVALQEVDRGVERSGGVDQDVILAERLGYRTAFAGARRRQGGDFGVALLSRLPFARVERIDLEVPFSSQPRVAIDATICVGDRPLRVVAVHADPFGLRAAADVLLREVSPSLGEGVILAGDLNATPEDLALDRLRQRGLTDVVGRFVENTASFGGFGGLRVDHILADAPLARRVLAAGVRPLDGSDHVPVWSDFDLSGAVRRDHAARRGSSPRAPRRRSTSCRASARSSSVSSR